MGQGELGGQGRDPPSMTVGRVHTGHQIRRELRGIVLNVVGFVGGGK